MVDPTFGWDLESNHGFLFVEYKLFQVNIELLGDGYQGDVIGESTPDVLVTEFVCSLFFTSLLFC